MRIDQQAFSFIELLIVIAIVAVVAAMLFPVLGRARESGRSTTCVSNMHQLSTAILMYVDTNEGPPTNSGGPWEEKIGLSKPNPISGREIGHESSILACPSYGRSSGDDDNSGYAMNGCYLAARQVADPSGSVLVAEVGSWLYKPGSGPYSSPTTRSFLDAPDSFFARTEFFEDPNASEVRPLGEWGALRHFGKGHYAMIDGHVATLPPSRFKVPAHDKWCRSNAKEWEGPEDGPHFALLDYEKKR